jgi:hypothetical protein
MSKAFRNQVSTIACLEGFSDMLKDIYHEIPEANQQSFLELYKILKMQSKIAQSFCKGNIDYKEYKRIESLIKQHSEDFMGSGGKFVDTIEYISFALIGFDSLRNSFKGVKKKNLNPDKIKAFDRLAQIGFSILQLFDTDLEEGDKYEKADKARETWEEIFAS